MLRDIQTILYLAVIFSMVHVQGFLNEEDILVDEEMEVRERAAQGGAFPSHRILDSRHGDEGSVSSPAGRSDANLDGQSSVASHTPSSGTLP